LKLNGCSYQYLPLERLFWGSSEGLLSAYSVEKLVGEAAVVVAILLMRVS